MLREVKHLHGAAIHAVDGEVGSVDEILFDDASWTVRYLIVKTGGWLFGRKVLISPLAFGHLDWENHALTLNLTREQIENSPGVDTDKPVSRQWETGYFAYYAWPVYWGGIGMWGAYAYPGALFSQPVSYAKTPLEVAEEDAIDHNDTHLRSTKEVTGYGLYATDGHIGHIQDFLVSDETWRIACLGVDTRDWWPGKHILMPLNWIRGVNWPENRVTVSVTREQVRNAPEWEPGQSISPGFEEELHAHYAMQHPQDRELAVG